VLPRNSCRCGAWCCPASVSEYYNKSRRRRGNAYNCDHRTRPNCDTRRETTTVIVDTALLQRLQRTGQPPYRAPTCNPLYDVEKPDPLLAWEIRTIEVPRCHEGSSPATRGGGDASPKAGVLSQRTPRRQRRHLVRLWHASHDPRRTG
jgi:hypothetical protein